MNRFKKISPTTIGLLKVGMPLMKYPVSGMIIFNTSIELPMGTGGPVSLFGYVSSIHDRQVVPYAIVNSMGQGGIMEVAYTELVGGRWWIDAEMVHLPDSMCPAKPTASVR